MLLLQLSPLLDGPCGLADTVDRTAEFAQDTGEESPERTSCSKACSSSVAACSRSETDRTLL